MHLILNDCVIGEVQMLWFEFTLSRVCFIRDFWIYSTEFSDPVESKMRNNVWYLYVYNKIYVRDCDKKAYLYVAYHPTSPRGRLRTYPTSTLQENEKNIWQLHNSCGLCWHYVLGYQLTALVRLSDQYGLVGHYLFFNCAISEVLYYVMEILRFSNTREI